MVLRLLSSYIVSFIGRFIVSAYISAYTTSTRLIFVTVKDTDNIYYFTKNQLCVGEDMAILFLLTQVREDRWDRCNRKLQFKLCVICTVFDK